MTEHRSPPAMEKMFRENLARSFSNLSEPTLTEQIALERIAVLNSNITQARHREITKAQPLNKRQSKTLLELVLTNVGKKIIISKVLRQILKVQGVESIYLPHHQVR